MTIRSAVAAALLVIPPPTALALFHNRLVKSAPAADEALATAPNEIRLWFAEKVEPKFSSITLMKPDSTKIAVGKPAATDDPKSIVAEVTAPLAAGSYTVVWRTAGDDGHAVRGRYSFSLK
jgi:methionine-rich copper-binding protein CopC